MVRRSPRVDGFKAAGSRPILWGMRGKRRSVQSYARLLAVVRRLDRAATLQRTRSKIRDEQRERGSSETELDESLLELRLWREAAAARVR